MSLTNFTHAGTYALKADAVLIGDTVSVAVQEGEVLLDIARRHNMGFDEMRLANVQLDPWLPPAGAAVTIPGRRILPAGPRRGIVLNLAERRLYYYPETAEGSGRQVLTYPVGIGREGWPTPLGATRIVGKVIKPTWYPPLSVRAEHAARGDPLPPRVPPGPDNPLGEYALLLDKPGYLIHGTNKPDGIGMRVSHGCVRMYPEDIEQLFQQVSKGTPVLVVDQPYKAAVVDGRLFLEIHPSDSGDTGKEPLWREIRRVLKGRGDIRWQDVQWPEVHRAFRQANGIPVAVSPAISGADRQQTVKREMPPEDQGAG